MLRPPHSQPPGGSAGEFPSSSASSAYGFPAFPRRRLSSAGSPGSARLAAAASSAHAHGTHAAAAQSTFVAACAHISRLLGSPQLHATFTSIIASIIALEPSFSPRAHSPSSSSLYLRLSERLFRASHISAALIGALFFVFCWLPVLWHPGHGHGHAHTPGLDLERTLRTAPLEAAAMQRPWTPDLRVKYQPLTAQQMADIIAGAQNPTADATDLSVASFTVHRFLSDGGSEPACVLTPPSLNPFTLGYQHAAPLRVGRKKQLRSHDWIKYSSPSTLASSSSTSHRLRSSRSGPRTSALFPNASALFQYAHNRWYHREFQLTAYHGQPIAETRRVRMVRDYTRFPSTVPTFISPESLSRYDLPSHRRLPPSTDLLTPSPSLLATPDRILLFYVFSYNYAEYMTNLQLFVRDCVRAHHPIDYVFIINQIPGREVDFAQLPPLPPNARYVAHKNECYDWGTVGWMLDLQDELERERSDAAKGRSPWRFSKLDTVPKLDMARYRYFILMNSSVRGPFFPSYVDLEDPRNGWWVPFLLMFKRDPTLQMVGPLINCEISPHVQSYVIVIDQEGLALLRGHTTAKSAAAFKASLDHKSIPHTMRMAFSDGNSVFECHTKLLQAVFKAEVGSSFLMIKSGFNIGSMARVQQGIDFRSVKNEECIGMPDNPSQNFFEGDSVTSGPHARHFLRQIDLLAKHHQHLVRLHAAKGDAPLDSAITDLAWQLRIIGDAKAKLVQRSIRVVLERQQAQPVHLANGTIDLDHQSVTPLLPQTVRVLRARPELLVELSREYDAHEAATKLAAKRAASSASASPSAAVAVELPAVTLHISSLVDLPLIASVAQEVASYRSPFASSLLEDAEFDRESLALAHSHAYPLNHPVLPAEFDLPSPLPPALMRRRVWQAARRSEVAAFSIDPLEVLFGKFKQLVKIEHAAYYERYRLAADTRRLRNQAKKKRKDERAWKKRNRHRWQRAWSRAQRQQSEPRP